MMFKPIINKLLMAIYFVFGALVLEVVTFSFLNIGFMPQYFLLNFSIILFVAILVYLIPNFVAQYVIFTIVLLVQTIFIYINYSLYTIYGDLFSFEMFKLAAEAGAAITSSFIYFSVILQLICVFLGIAIVGYILLKICRKDKVDLKQHFSIFSVIIMICLQCFSWGYYVSMRRDIISQVSIEDKNYVSSDTFLMSTSLMKMSSYAKFGTYGYFTNLIFNNFTNDSFNHIKTATIDYFNNGNIYQGSDLFEVDKNNNVIVIMMESLEWLGFGDGNYDPTLSNLSSELTPNIYSLIYGEGDNKSSGIHANDSLIARNFFAKSKTNMSEGVGIMGSYPVGKNLADIVGNGYNKDLNSYGYSLPNVLKNLGYSTSYVHSNFISYYNRDTTHPNLGFEQVVGKDCVKDELGNQVYTGDDLKWDNWDNEGNFAKNAMKYIVPDSYEEKPFYTFYLNVSSHGSYTEDRNKNDKDYLKYYDYIQYGEDNCILNDKGYYKFDETLLVGGAKRSDFYTNWYKNVYDTYYETDSALCKELLFYECGVKGLDDAVGEIVQKLKSTVYTTGEKTGETLFDNTTLLLYSDHYSYFDGLSNRYKGFDKNDFSSIELNTIPMILCSPGLKEYNATNNDYDINIYDEFTSAFDIVPTLLDLLGIKFNENIYIGKSLFKQNENTYVLDGKTYPMNVFYSNTGGMFSQHVYTYNFKDYIAEDINVDNLVVDTFEKVSYDHLRKLNYLQILNNYYLYNEITNI